jgi:hypothetical protein
MAVLVDHGIPGALLYVGLVAWAGILLLRLRAMDKLGLPPSLGALRAAIGSALVGCFVSGQFINFVKAEPNIWLIAMLAALYNVAARSVALQEERVPECTEPAAALA